MQSLRGQLLAFVPKEQAALAAGEIGRPDFPDGYHMGGKFKLDRLKIVAEYCLCRYAGDLVEIGILGGGTTIEFAKLASQYGRRVIAVDPWLPKSSGYKAHGGCTETTKQEFIRRTWKYRHLIDIIHDFSQSEAAIHLIKSRALCFAYIDGAHYYEPCRTDMETVSHCVGIIAVDDLWIEGVRRAFEEAGQCPDWEAFSHHILRRDICCHADKHFRDAQALRGQDGYTSAQCYKKLDAAQR